jgi:hypothetical protein
MRDEERYLGMPWETALCFNLKVPFHFPNSRDERRRSFENENSLRIKNLTTRAYTIDHLLFPLRVLHTSQVV